MIKKIYDKLYFSKSEIKIIISLFLLFVVGFLTKHFINLRNDEFVSINNPVKDSIFNNSSFSSTS